MRVQLALICQCRLVSKTSAVACCTCGDSTRLRAVHFPQLSDLVSVVRDSFRSTGWVHHFLLGCNDYFWAEKITLLLSSPSLLHLLDAHSRLILLTLSSSNHYSVFTATYPSHGIPQSATCEFDLLNHNNHWFYFQTSCAYAPTCARQKGNPQGFIVH